MNKQDIDNIFKMMIEEKSEEVLKMANDERLISKVIEANGDYSDELIKQCCSNILDQIKDNELYEYFEKTGLSTDENKDTFTLILGSNTLTPEQVDKYIGKLSISDQCSLVAATHDVEYIKKYIDENNEKIYSYQKIELVKATKNSEYIKEYIENPKVDLFDKISLVKEVNDKEYMKSFVENENISSSEKMNIILKITDVEYTKECIANKKLGLDSNNKIELISSTNDKEYIKSFIENESVSNPDKVRLIEKMNDIEYTKECVESESLGLDSNDKIELISSTNDKEYIKSFIENKNVSNPDKVRLIGRINDVEYIKECIENEKLGFDKKEKFQLVLLTEDEEYIDKNLNLNNDIKKINLPDNMTIGVEIEAEGIEKVQYKNMFSNWKSKGDGSLKDGIEVVSPVLSGSNEDSKNIYKACYMLENLGCSTSERCGGHVHIGADFLKDKQAYLNLLEIFGDSEEILYTISNNAGEITRMGGASHYAVPISKKIENALESGKIDLKNSEDISKFASEIKEVQGNRYSGINFMNVGEGGKNTVEFRLANGTINPETWIENINLFGGVIVSAQSMSKIQAKDEQDRTEQEKSDLKKFEMLKNKTISNEERLDMLLDLTVSKEDKEIYQNRYKENSKLLEKNDIVSKSIKGQISEETLNFEDKKKKLFEDAIDVTKVSVTTKDIVRQDKNIENIIRENSIDRKNNVR